MSETVTIPRSSAQWILEHMSISGTLKVQLFQAISKVQLEPELAAALKRSCMQQLEVLNFGGSGEGSDIVSQLKTLMRQLDDG